MSSEGSITRAVLFGILVIGVFVVAPASAQFISEEPPKTEVPYYYVTLNIGISGYDPQLDDEELRDEWIENAVLFGAHFTYQFHEYVGVEVGGMATQVRLHYRDWDDENYKPLIWANEIRAAIRANMLTGWVRPYFSLGPSVVILDFDSEFPDQTAWGGNANLGFMFFLVDWAGVEARGGFSLFFPQDDLQNLHAWNATFGAFFAF